MINLETTYPGKVTASSASYPYGEPRNITTPGDGTGTPWEEAIVKDWAGFDAALVDEAGITPTNTPDTATASQRLDAIFAILKSTRNPFQNYACFQYVENSGTNGDALAATTWTKVPLATTIENNISGLTLTSGVFQLPAGDYRFKFSQNASVAGDTRAISRIRDTTTGPTTAAVGLTSIDDGDGSNPSQACSSGVGTYTASVTTDFELQIYSQSVGTMGADISSGEDNIYGIVEIWKVG